MPPDETRPTGSGTRLLLPLLAVLFAGSAALIVYVVQTAEEIEAEHLRSAGIERTKTARRLRALPPAAGAAAGSVTPPRPPLAGPPGEGTVPPGFPDPGRQDPFGPEHPGVRARIGLLEKLVAERGAEAAAVLRACVDDPNEPDSVRAAAARLLGGTGAGAFRALEELLHGPYGEAVRAGAVAGLARCEDERAAIVLGQFLRGPDPALRRAAILGVSESNAPGALALAAEELGNTTIDDPSRVRLAEGLGRARHAPAIPALLQVAADRHSAPSVRCAAIDSVAAIGDASALRSLGALASDASPEVAARAAAAERTLRGPAPAGR